MSSIIMTNYTNAVVGKLQFVSDDGVALLECDDPFQLVTVPVKISNVDDAMILIDQFVCVYENKVGRLA